ncbi:MAG: GNAT family N-acetyltransferase [Planctomycetes bacterium]|nr:GNAT family N-acetyltransferase [Planctomycetota bacterium]
MPKIELQPVSASNYAAVLALDVKADQRGFVAPNVKSIADSKIWPTHYPLAILADGEPVGFCMWGQDPDDGHFHIPRLMIDAKHQRKGFGRAAALELVKLVASQPGCDAILLSFMPANTGAEALYASIGFKRTGEVQEGEIVMRYDVT